MDLSEELERLADTLTPSSLTTTEDPLNPSTQTIQKWMSLFTYTHAQAQSLIIAQAEDFAHSTRLTSTQWALIREEKEALGFDRRSYEHSLELLMKGGASTSNGEKKMREGPSVRESGYSFLMRLESPLDSVEMVQMAAEMETRPDVIEDEEKTARFCRVDGVGKWKIGNWIEENAKGFVPTFTRIAMPARKKLDGDSCYPMLGVESTLPQFRGEVAGPREGEWPLWYFFYGTLEDRGVLGRVLSLREREGVVLREASILGGVLKVWGGKYKALVDGLERAKVDGSAFLVTCKEHEDALRQYETDNYEVVRCKILMKDGEKVEGCTFRFVGEVD